MTPVFVDASYLLAPVLNERGRLARIREAERALGEIERVTSYGVLSEVLARVSDRGPRFRRDTAAYVQSIVADPASFTVVAMTPERFDRGLALYADRLDQRYSLEDCVSMEIMREMEIQVVLTFDSDFHGERRFTVLPAPIGTRPPQP